MKIHKVVCSQCGNPLGTAIDSSQGYRQFMPGLLQMSAYNSDPINSVSILTDTDAIESYKIFCSSECYLQGDV